MVSFVFLDELPSSSTANRNRNSNSGQSHALSSAQRNAQEEIHHTRRPIMQETHAHALVHAPLHAHAHALSSSMTRARGVTRGDSRMALFCYQPSPPGTHSFELKGSPFAAMH